MTKKEKEIISRSSTSVAENLTVNTKDAISIVTKAIAGGEIQEINETEIANWIKDRLIPNTIFIDFDGYTKMCVDALKIASVTAATDYGSSRQRDLGQLWADMTRGYLGEYAFKLYLKENWGLNIELGHETGELEEYLPTDIEKVLDSNGNWRKANILLSIKTTKFNGIWLDIPGDQFNHSDIHTLIKVAAGRDHLFAYLKDLSVFRDKVLKSGVDKGSLTEVQAKELFDKLPDFSPIPAYVCGFVKKDDAYLELPYAGKKGTKNYKITEWNGPLLPGDLDKIKATEGISVPCGNIGKGV
nr:hypothetical protein [candidate division Zixibacteria bacterium]